MNKFKRFLAKIFVFVMLVTTALPAYAAESVTKDGMKLTLTTDKQSYAQDETIIATIKVENTNNYAVSGVSLEGIIPSGYKLKTDEGVSMIIGEMPANSSKELSVKFEPIIVEEAEKYLKQILKCPIHLQSHIKVTLLNESANLVAQITM